MNSLTDEEALMALTAWELWARPEQLPPPGDWTTWLYMGGRGAGKTRAGAEWIRARVHAGTAKRIALVAATFAEARDVLVRLLDAAASARDPASLALSAGKSDDSCAPVAASALAANVAANYSAARANEEQLDALEAWLRAESAPAAGATTR